VAACEVLSLLLLLLLVAGACEVGAGSSEVGAGSSVVEAVGAAEDAGGALDAGGADDVSGAAEDVAGVGVGVGVLFPVPWAWRFSFWWRYSLMPSMCRPSKVKADAMATRANRANNHVWRIMVSVSMSMSMSMAMAMSEVYYVETGGCRSRGGGWVWVKVTAADAFHGQRLIPGLGL
jgi:hypothetical protein